jgi:nitrite reductase/ring-hydroxylating ferredoxin subunit
MAHFPLNAWYAAAYDVELKRVLLPRTICNRKMVFYRLQDGSPAALEDACWHRLLPLSHGPAGRRRGGLRLPRSCIQCRGPLHTHAVARDAEPVGLRAQPIRWWSATASSGCGRVMHRWPTRR